MPGHLFCVDAVPEQPAKPMRWRGRSIQEATRLARGRDLRGPHRGGTTPGTLLPGKKPDRPIGTLPKSRNEKLASSFRRYRIGEERATGFQKIVTTIEVFGLRSSASKDLGAGKKSVEYPPYGA